MISVEGDFVRTWWYGRRRIRHKARKYRRFGGVRIILGWHTLQNFNIIIHTLCVTVRFIISKAIENVPEPIFKGCYAAFKLVCIFVFGANNPIM